MIKSDWCPRQTLYRLRCTDPSDEPPPFSFQTSNIFEEGNIIHTKWQRWLGLTGRLWGKWWCPRCQATETGTGARDCARCGAQKPAVRTPMKYNEIPQIGRAHV